MEAIRLLFSLGDKVKKGLIFYFRVVSEEV